MTNKQVYQHRYGGLYTVDFAGALSTIDKSEWVVYTHVYPFEVQTWIRPAAEWNDGRFVPIDGEALTTVLRTPQEEMQKRITEAKVKAKK